jgi:ABC-2 family transporter protein
MFSLPVYNMVFLLVKEKESKTRETMKIMGLSELPYWGSWFAYYTIVNTAISFIAWCILIINVIVISGRW